MHEKSRFYKIVGAIAVATMLLAVVPMGPVVAQADGVMPALQSGGDRLVDLQNDDGGWDWELDDGNPASASPLNTVGPIAKGLAEAYKVTGDPEQLEALEAAGSFLLTKTNNFSPSDGYLAAVLDEVFGGTMYVDHLMDNLYRPLSAGTYDKNGAGTLYDTADFVQAIRDSRSGTQANLAAWDVGMGLVGAASCGAETSAWIAGVKAEINELNNLESFDVIGLAGAVYGLAFVDESFDPEAGAHAAATSVEDLANILASYQIDGGGFAWNSQYVIAEDYNEAIQETAYAILALNEVDRNAYLDNIIGATDYMFSVQMDTGGWQNEEYYGGENNEVTGEALWGIAAAYPQLWVCESGDCGHPGAQFSTIQAAIDAAVEGATINVAAGIYDEENILITKGLTLQGAGADTTFIAPNAVTNASTIVVRNPTSDVLIDGFTFAMQPKPDYGSAVVVTGTTIEVDSATVTISHNVVNGSGNATVADFGFYGQGNHAKLVITDNVISKTGDNPICMEKQMGSTVVSNNTIYIADNVDYNPYFSMTYGGNIVTTSQIVTGNTFYLDHAGTGWSEAITFVSSALGNWNNDPTDSGGYRDIQITNNVIYGGGEGARGIGIFDNSHADNQGTISGVVISGNQFIGENPTDPTTIGIYLSGDIEGTEITGNSIEGVLTGMQLKKGSKNAVEPSGTVIEYNKITNTGTALLWEGTGELDASPNWWGSMGGPVDEQLAGDIGFKPWCGDEDCSFFVPDENNVIVLDGTYNIPGGIVINQPGLTFLLKDGTVIENNSPCFLVNADNTTIKAESNLGATCIATNGSSGIEVADGVSGVTIQGLEITDDDAMPGKDGIEFQGEITNLQIVDNYIHGLPASGISFAQQPQWEPNSFYIQGNLIKNNGTAMDNSALTAEINAEYNAWGDIAGTGALTNVDADPWTHVDIYIESTGSPWANQVVNGETITFAVKANMEHITTAAFELSYPTSLLAGPDINDETGLFSAIFEDLVSVKSGVIRFDGYATSAVSATDLTLFTVTFDAVDTGSGALAFNGASALFGMSPDHGPSVNVYADVIVDGSVNVIELPTLESEDIQGYYLTGEPRDFTVRTFNPVTGAAFTNVLFRYTIYDAEISDIASFTYADGDMILTQDGSNLVGYFGPVDGFAMNNAPYDVTTTFNIEFNTAKDYDFELELVDLTTSPETALATLTDTAKVYDAPELTPNIPTEFMSGEEVEFSVNLANPGTGIETNVYAEIVLEGLADDAISSLKYFEVADGQWHDLPYTMDAGKIIIHFGPAEGFAMSAPYAQDARFKVIFDTNVNIIDFSYSGALYDADFDPDRVLAILPAGTSTVYANFDLTGTISMQGRTVRSGVEVMLDGTYDDYSGTTLNVLGSNLGFEDVIADTYLLTTSQARYLNISADLDKLLIVSGDAVIPALELIGGNVYETVESSDEINLSDATVIGANYNELGENPGDANFDGRVNIQDLALVGGNYEETSLTVYGDWLVEP